jgi:hypothetical protein
MRRANGLHPVCVIAERALIFEYLDHVLDGNNTRSHHEPHISPRAFQYLTTELR